MKNFVFFREDIENSRVDAGCVEEIPVECILGFAGRVDKEQGIMRCVTVGAFEKFLAKAGKNLDNKMIQKIKQIRLEREFAWIKDLLEDTDLFLL